MARPIKAGLGYFPFDVDFFSDFKIRSLRANYGADGIALYMYCLCQIYRNGYYVKADDDFVDCAAVDLGLTIDKTRQIMKYFCRRSLFDSTLLTTVTILTAKSVQRRFQEARKSSKRDIFVDEKLWLLENDETLGFIKVRPFLGFSENNPSFSEKNPCNNSSFSENNPTKGKEKKEKEMKGKEKKEECSADALTLPSPSQNSFSSLPAAAPTEKPPNLREQLSRKYGEDNVTRYEKRYRKWQAKSGRAGDVNYITISHWLEEDNVKPQDASDLCTSSFDVDEIVKQIKEKYAISDDEVL